MLSCDSHSKKIDRNLYDFYKLKIEKGGVKLEHHSKTPSQKRFAKLIKKQRESLFSIYRRLYFFEATEDQFKLKAQGEKYILKNSIQLLMYRDMYRVLVIELTSCAKSLFFDEGIISNLIHFLPEMKVPGRAKIPVPRTTIIEINNQLNQSGIDRLHKEYNKEHRIRIQEDTKEILEALFPRLKTINTFSKEEYKVTRQDLDSLRNKYLYIIAELKTLRNSFAHPVESKEGNEIVRPLSLERLKEFADLLKDLLNRIQTIVTQSYTEYDLPAKSESERVADDFVDLAVLGSINQIFNAFEIPQAIKDSHENTLGPIYFKHFRELYWKNHKIPVPDDGK